MTDAAAPCAVCGNAVSPLAKYCPLGVVTETDQWAWEPRLLWLKGCVAAESRESAKAEECFRRSLEIARSQGGRTDELRAAKSLADPAFTAS